MANNDKKVAPKKTRNKKKGGAPKGNEFWRMRSSHGRKPIFKKPEDLLEACFEYFQWVHDNPLMASEVVKYQGEAKLTQVPKMRAMTIGGLCIFLDITFETWTQYRKKEGFSEVSTRVEEIIRTQKFEGAAADLLNHAIIARDLGLADKQEHTGNDGKPISIQDVNDMPLNEKVRRIAFMFEEAIRNKEKEKKLPR